MTRFSPLQHALLNRRLRDLAPAWTPPTYGRLRRVFWASMQRTVTLTPPRTSDWRLLEWWRRVSHAWYVDHVVARV